MGHNGVKPGDHPISQADTNDEHTEMLRSLTPLTAPEGKGRDLFGEQQTAVQGGKETKKG